MLNYDKILQKLKVYLFASREITAFSMFDILAVKKIKQGCLGGLVSWTSDS